MSSDSDLDMEMELEMDMNIPHNARTTFGFPKPFPNNYTSLSLNPEFLTPQEKPICMIERSFTSDASFFITPEQSAKMAGMKIFATVMLNAWRRRRAECKHLYEKLEELKQGSMRAKNQLHVYNTLFRVEQRRNDELTCKLKHSLVHINEAKSSCENLTTSLISLKADHALLEQELNNKYKDTDNMNVVLMQTKAELFRIMMEHRNLKSQLVKEQRKLQFMESQKNKLINEICELGAENRKAEEKYSKDLEIKEEELTESKRKVKHLEKEINEIKEKTTRNSLKISGSEILLKREVQLLRLHCTALRQELNASLNNRIKGIWKQLCCYQQSTMRFAHILAFYLLPATPKPVDPKFPWAQKFLVRL